MRTDPSHSSAKEPAKDQGGDALLMERLFAARSIFIYGAINENVARMACSQLVALSQDSDEPINIYINSPGGHVKSGDSIYDFIKFVRAPVRVIGSGWVASAATLIFVSAKKSNRYCLPNTRFMIHQPSGGASGHVSDIEIQLEEILNTKERLNRTIARETGQPIERIKQDSDRDHWMSSEEAVKYGIVGSIIDNIRDLK